MKSKIVIALGGNALGNTPKEQRLAVQSTAVSIVDLIEEGNQVIISHGNGPQVGLINSVFNGDMPFPECGAMSQGYIGYHLQQSIKNELMKRKINKDVVTIVTQSIVDENDMAFQNPTKPIGGFVTKEEMEILHKSTGDIYVEDSGRGYRKVVASPIPIDFVEKDIISCLVNNDKVVISAGGGGVPVYLDEEGYKGIDCVIDKDFASSKMAEILNAEFLIILTAVEKVAINFGKSNEEWLNTISSEQAIRYCNQGHFAPGSMLPKVKAAIEFVKGNPNGKALITSLSKAADGIKGLTGTTIIN